MKKKRRQRGLMLAKKEVCYIAGALNHWQIVKSSPKGYMMAGLLTLWENLAIKAAFLSKSMMVHINGGNKNRQLKPDSFCNPNDIDRAKGQTIH